ncbi:malate dehydrogenase [Reticulomyxa filosa]|uniref:Malate dehydrogenase n=1 Tax=Reticulomyxa filosa TaxID=46433 RepID=X6PE01_RETFI|nr:malate dehydrogenase [Reticulomyxa filosa]|eukprot:ETO35877.1 malate dehydrogenase [Reticulomyxa filosa]
MFPDLQSVRIHGVPWRELIGYFRAERFWQNEFIPKVQQRGAQIISVRGSSSAASAANAALAHTRDWVLGSPQCDWTSMAVLSQGEYGVPSGLVSSFPVLCNNGSWQIVNPSGAFTAFQQYYIEQSIKELESERDMVSEMLKF